MTGSDTIVCGFDGFSLPCRALTLAGIKAAAKIDFDSLPKWISSMISGRIGAVFISRALRRMPMRLLCRLQNAMIRAQYGALLNCPGDWRERLMLGKDPRTPFARYCDEEAAHRLAENGRGRLEYYLAQLTSCVCSIFGGKAKASDFLLPEGTFGKAKEKPVSAEDQIKGLAAAMGAKVIDHRPEAINQL